MGIIIFGASGAGSTTLGKEVARRLNFQYLDIDDYLWCWNTVIPLTVVRPREERTKGLLEDIKKYPDFVIAGTIFSDKDLFAPLLDLAVFISTPADTCAERVQARELARWGERVLPGGDMYKTTRFHGDFDDYVSNAQKYETADVVNFSRKLHERWIKELPCPVLRLDGTNDISQNTDCIIAQFHKATDFANKVTKDKRILFELAVEPDPFYTETNMNRIRMAIADAKVGKNISECELLEVDGD